MKQFKPGQEVWAYDPKSRYWYRGKIIRETRTGYAVEIKRKQNLETSVLKDAKALESKNESYM
jgi:hypothetical protein